MDYFAGLDISMDETHVCVLDREGGVVRESKTASTGQAIAAELAAQGHLNERGKPFAAKSVASMLAS